MTTAIIVAIAVAAIAASVGLGAPLVGAALRRVEPSGQTPGVLRGGMWVGILERAMVTGAILIGAPEAVAVVVAIKGLGRYPELSHTEGDARAEAAERFIIGTLASLLWAGALGFAGRYAIVALA